MVAGDVAPLVAIVGETASGKSALAMVIAERCNGEIIAADSRTVYKGMDIGTAKPSREDRERIPHYGLDMVTPAERFTAFDFKNEAIETMASIVERGKVPILVGGTGLYIDSVIFDYRFNQFGAERDETNPRHLKNPDQTDRSAMRSNTLVIGMRLEPEILRKRIRERVDQMVDAGLIGEVERLTQKYGAEAPALQAPGYKAFQKYLLGEVNLEQAKAEFIKNDLALAKRQRTWFKRNQSIHWIQKQIEAVDLITTFLNK